MNRKKRPLANERPVAEQREEALRQATKDLARILRCKEAEVRKPRAKKESK